MLATPPMAPLPEAEEPRTRRIVEVALHLAEQGGFSAVRLRDVAQEAGVALRTLYKRFPSKDDLLFAVLAGEMLRLEQQLGGRPPSGPTPVARVHALFEFLTEFLCGRPNLGRAVARALSGGSVSLTEQVSTFHLRIAALVAEAVQGHASPPPVDPEHPHLRLASMLQHVWFSSLITWSNGRYDRAQIVAAVTDAAALVLDPPHDPA
ncbi:MAG: TetR/AcrR family transcriptional regulator [Myxococcota bacterium]